MARSIAATSDPLIRARHPLVWICSPPSGDRHGFSFPPSTSTRALRRIEAARYGSAAAAIPASPVQPVGDALDPLGDRLDRLGDIRFELLLALDHGGARLLQPGDLGL